MSTPTLNFSRQRLEALSDGVFSILLTLLVLELRLPSLGHGATDEQLASELVRLTPKALAWMLSFSLGAMFWVAQQNFLTRVAVISPALLRLELSILAVVSLLPFSTALVGEYGAHRPAAVVYALHLTLIAGLAWWRAAYLERRPTLQAPGVEAASFRGLRFRMRLFTGCALAAVLLGFLLPGWNMLALVPAVAARLSSEGRVLARARP